MGFDYDFIGFSYNGKHSINYFGIYRTSDGSRYNDNLVPTMTDKTADVPGGNGQYYFSTFHKTRQFSIPIAFDGLTESKYREMRQWLDGKGIYDLIFDEAPYKVYSAKVTGTPQLKTVCFSIEGQRIYKGEGTIQFTCYYPYAHTPLGLSETSKMLGGEIGYTLKCGIVAPYGTTLKIEGDSTGGFNCIDLVTNQKFFIVMINGETHTFQNNTLIESFDVKNISNSFYGITIDGEVFVYTQKGCYMAGNRTSYKNINAYNIIDYPNKAEWASAFLQNYSTNINNKGYNGGDIPAPFKVTTPNSEETKEGAVLEVGNCKITIKQDCFGLEWDSKTGLVTGQIVNIDGRVPINYTGTSYGTLAVGQNTINIPQNATLDYQFWYY